MKLHLRRLVSLTVSLLVVLTAFPRGADAQVQTQLTNNQQATLDVVVSAKAGDRVREAAATLADYLGRISGATFEVVEGDGKSGIAVGLPGDFPGLQLGEALGAQGAAGLEQYLLRSHAQGVRVIGASELAVGHAVWDLLYRLGHRQFFPGDTWEVVPSTPDLSVAVDVNETPDYLTRRIWYGYGFWDYNLQPYRNWQARNRAASVFGLNTGHAYGRIVSEYKAEFEAHPEYFCLVNDKRTSKLCAGQPGLRDLVVRYALRHFEKNPTADSISIDPSDGGGWGEQCPCVEIGTPTDRALTLANVIGEALDKHHPDKFVGMYAYNEHSPPPTIKVHPRVIISVATSFIRGGYTVDELLEGWSKQGVQQFGIREYYSVQPWDHNLPGRGRGGRLDYLARTIPHFHTMGARFMSAESGDNWGAYGLGYYLASRMLWDVSAAERIDELKADFFDKAFGPAREPMAKFYALLDGSNRALLSDDMVGRMYRLLDEANSLASGDPAVQARLDDLTLYTRYVELFRAYSGAGGEARQAAFEQMIRHAYRMRKTMMVHTKAIYRDDDRRDKRVAIPEGAGWKVAEDSNPWKSSEPFTRDELRIFIDEGIANHDLVNFEAESFSSDLVPASPLGLSGSALGEPAFVGRGKRVYYTWVDKAPAEINLTVTGGLIAHYRDRGDATIHLYPVDEVEGLAVAEAAVPPDGEPRNVTLKTSHTGLHRIEVSDGRDMTRVQWDPQQRITFETSLESSPSHSGRQTYWFYVPRGTKLVGGFAQASEGVIQDGDGQPVHTFGEPGYFEVPVGANQDGKLWRVERAAGPVKLMTVPPFGSLSPEALLLPREVVEADAP